MKKTLAIGVGITMLGAAFVVYNQTTPLSLSLKGDVMQPMANTPYNPDATMVCCTRGDKSGYCIPNEAKCLSDETASADITPSQCSSTCGMMKTPPMMPTTTPPTMTPKMKMVTINVANNMNSIAGKKEGGNGTINGDGLACTQAIDSLLDEGICEVQKGVGSSITFTASPLLGFKFVKWGASTGGDGETCPCNDSEKPTCSFRVPDKNVECGAWYKPLPYIQVEVSATDNNGGYVSAVIDGTKTRTCTDSAPCVRAMRIGKPVNLTAMPGKNEHFAAWYNYTGECPCEEKNPICSFGAAELPGLKTYYCHAIFLDNPLPEKPADSNAPADTPSATMMTPAVGSPATTMPAEGMMQSSDETNPTTMPVGTIMP